MIIKQGWLWETGVVFRSGAAFSSSNVLVHVRRSHDAVCEILEAVVQLGRDGTHGAVHHLLHQHLQLLLRQVHVESLLQVTYGAGAVKAGELRTCRTQTQFCSKAGRFKNVQVVCKVGLCN